MDVCLFICFETGYDLYEHNLCKKKNDGAIRIKLDCIASIIASFSSVACASNLDFSRCVLRCARSKVRPVGKCFQKKQKQKADAWWSKQSRTSLKLSLCLKMRLAQ